MIRIKNMQIQDLPNDKTQKPITRDTVESFNNFSARITPRNRSFYAEVACFVYSRN